MNLRWGGEQEEGEREPWLAYKMNIFFFYKGRNLFFRFSYVLVIISFSLILSYN